MRTEELILEQLQLINGHLGQIDKRLDCLETHMNGIESHMDRMEAHIDNLESNIIDITREQKYIKLILENDIKRNISMVAEGHINLDRKLNQFREELTDRHLLDIRLAVLEGDVSVLKEKVEVLTA